MKEIGVWNRSSQQQHWCSYFCTHFPWLTKRFAWEILPDVVFSLSLVPLGSFEGWVGCTRNTHWWVQAWTNKIKYKLQNADVYLQQMFPFIKPTWADSKLRNAFSAISLVQFTNKCLVCECEANLSPMILPELLIYKIFQKVSRIWRRESWFSQFPCTKLTWKPMFSKTPNI